MDDQQNSTSKRRADVSLAAPAVTTLASLPMQLRVLCYSLTEPSWDRLAVRLQESGCREPRFQWTDNARQSLVRLRAESFDLVLAFVESHDQEAMRNTLSIAQAMRTSGQDDAFLIVTDSCRDSDASQLLGLNCELLVTDGLWASGAVLPAICKAVAQVDVQRDNQRLGTAHHRRVMLERDEALRLLQQQREMIEARQFAPGHSESERAEPVPDSVLESIQPLYDELLRTFVIMGSGSLETEIADLVELMDVAGFGPHEALQLHLKRVESLVSGLGQRSSRHVMSRADVMALELMTNLADRFYRRLNSQ